MATVAHFWEDYQCCIYTRSFAMVSGTHYLESRGRVRLGSHWNDAEESGVGSSLSRSIHLFSDRREAVLGAMKMYS